MPSGPVSINPWTYESWDYQRKSIRITVPWDATTRAQQGATLHRDSGCVYHQIVLGDPATAGANRVFDCPADGQPDVTVGAQQLRNNGLTTIDDVVAVQVTARP